MSQRARVMGLERPVGYRRERMRTITTENAGDLLVFTCGCCANYYSVSCSVADQHEEEPLCSMCAPVGRQACEDDLRLARLLGKGCQL